MTGPVAMSEGLRERFIGLACALSPENLSCDGEASRAEQTRRLGRIMREWRALEAEAGRKVKVSEAEGWMMEDFERRWEEKKRARACGVCGATGCCEHKSVCDYLGPTCGVCPSDKPRRGA